MGVDKQIRIKTDYHRRLKNESKKRKQLLQGRVEDLIDKGWLYESLLAPKILTDCQSSIGPTSTGEARP